MPVSLALVIAPPPQKNFAEFSCVPFPPVFSFAREQKIASEQKHTVDVGTPGPPGFRIFLYRPFDDGIQKHQDRPDSGQHIPIFHLPGRMSFQRWVLLRHFGNASSDALEKS